MHKELVKSKAPRRWMAVFLTLLVICGVALALMWVRSSNAAGSEDADLAMAWAEDGSSWDLTQGIQCEMVRVWPLPSECLFVFRTASSAR